VKRKGLVISNFHTHFNPCVKEVKRKKSTAERKKKRKKKQGTTHPAKPLFTFLRGEVIKRRERGRNHRKGKDCLSLLQRSPLEIQGKFFGKKKEEKGKPKGDARGFFSFFLVPRVNWKKGKKKKKKKCKKRKGGGGGRKSHGIHADGLLLLLPFFFVLRGKRRRKGKNYEKKKKKREGGGR